MKVSLIELQLLFHASSLILHPRFFLTLSSLAFLIVAPALVAFMIVALIVAACALVVVASSRHKKSSRAPLDLVGRIGTIERDLEPEGAVLVGGELFPARTRTGETIMRARGARVRVVGARGHFIEVERED